MEKPEQVEDEGVSDENCPEDLTSQEDIDKSNASKYLLDGGAVPHHVTWKVSIFKELFQDYISNVNLKYGLCTLVFDGYNSISTKDHEHRGRAAQVPPCSDVSVTSGTNIFHTREDILSNNGSKMQFIRLLSEVLQKEVHTVINCEGDAGTYIVDAALDVTCDNNIAIVVAEDTDILILLIYFWNSEMADVYLRTEEKKYQPVKLVKIRSVVEYLSSDVVHNILFIHAWSCCDTTSATYGHEKTALLKLVKKGHSTVMKICSTFNNLQSSQMEIAEAGHILFCMRYGKFIICHHDLTCRNFHQISW